MALEVTKATFDETVSKGVTLIDFWAPWCGPCRMQGPIIDELSEELKGKANIGKVNVDNEPELASQFGVMSIPTLILFKDGQPVDKMVGLQSKAVLQSKIQNLM
jgi:thioredoxin 1